MGARDDMLAIPDELLRNGEIAEAAVVSMSFRDNPKLWWTGAGDLILPDGTYSGMGDIISISPINSSFAPTAEAVTFNMAATPEMIALAEDAEEAVIGRDVSVDGQFLAQGAGGWTPIGAKFNHFSGTMEKMRYSMSGSGDGSVSLLCEGLFYRRTSAPRGYLTDVDQKARYPGDRGAEYVAKYEDYSVKWR